MTYTKKDIYVGFTLGSKATCFTVKKLVEGGVELHSERGCVWGLYPYKALFQLMSYKGWDYHIKNKQLNYEIY